MGADTEKSGPQGEERLLLVVRIRGTVADNPSTEMTLKTLGMAKKFNARILTATDSTLGMLRRAKDLVTWGEVEPETLEALLTKRVERRGTRTMKLDEDFSRRIFEKQNLGDLAKSMVAGEVGTVQLSKAGVKPTIRLHPPKGGFKRSTRKSFNGGGELGYRGREINRLVKRMI